MGDDMRESAVLDRVKQGYTTGARSLASRSIVGLARTRVTPNALTAAGVSLCLAAAVLVFFEDRNELLFYWVGAAVFVCDNLSFSGDVKLARRHTAHVERDLPQLVSRAVGRLAELRAPEVTASALNAPERICGSMNGTSETRTWIWPPNISATAGPTPR